MTTKLEIEGWFEAGVVNGATHLIVVCDTFDYDDYPVYATGDADVLQKYKEYQEKPMQRVVEVYDLLADKQAQMAERRALRLPSCAQT